MTIFITFSLITKRLFFSQWKHANFIYSKKSSSMFDNIKITDIIAAFSGAITAITSVIMAVLAYRQFIKSPEQEDVAEGSPTAECSSAPSINTITIFKTSKQTTILSVVNRSLQCEIVDKRPGRGGIQWTFQQDLCKKILDQKLVRANPNFKPRTGLITIGPKTNWLYSKALYWDHTVLENDIYALLEATM